jgi:predicted dehydrogenase
MGCGAVADYGHVPAIQETPGLVLQALYDPSAEAARRLQEKHRVPSAFTDANAFFASGLDAVSITSPAPCHKANVLEAARHGLPVICEKPLAMDSAEAGDMIAAMERAGVSLYSAFCYRFSPCALKIRELVRAQAIGDVRSLRLIYNWNLHGKYVTDADGRRTIQKRREGRMLEGGPMVDCGTHQIDLAVFWLGSEVTRVCGHGAWVDDYEAPDHMWVHMDHANGAHTVVEISYSYHHTSRNKRSEFVYELIGRDGVIRYDREAASFTMENGSGSHAFEFHPEKSFTGMYAEWARALGAGRSDLLTSARDGMRVVDIARTATDAAILNRRSRPVD